MTESVDPNPEPRGERCLELRAATRFGRYTLFEKLGAGAMGTVWAAYDPHLDRKVALKLLHPELSPERQRSHRMRLMREAKVLAKLSHPNVVTVYDVALLDDQLYIAMEFVDGKTMDEWVRVETPSWSELLRVYRAAAAGLAAAHEQGIVHRDIKPSNIVVGNDGRVRVLDFGIAKRAIELSDAMQDHDETLDDVAPLHDVAAASKASLTRTGAELGTPGYMALEQFRYRHIVGPATDQFALAVSLYESLYGDSPFAHASLLQRLQAMEDGEILTPDPDTTVPSWVFDALVTALQPSPEDRYPSMNAFAEALRGPPSQRHRVGISWRAFGAIALGVGGLLATGVIDVGGISQSVACSGSERYLEGRWDDDLRQQLRERVRTMKPAHIPTTLRHVEATLDAYGQAWADGHRDACEATHVRRDQSPELMDLRMDCLHGRLRDLGSVTKALLTADVEALAEVNSALSSLPSVESCRDPEYVRERARLQFDPDRQADLDAIRDELAAVDALDSMTRYREALDRARLLLPPTSELKVPCLEAEVNLRIGRSALALELVDEAEKALESAYFESRTCDSTEVAAESASYMMFLQGRYRGLLKSSRWWDKLATQHAQGTEERLLAHHLTRQSDIYCELGDTESAVESAMQGLARLKELKEAQKLQYLVGARRTLCALKSEPDTTRGLDEINAILRLNEAMMGPEHPSNAQIHIAIAQVYIYAGSFSKAEDAARRALLLLEQAFGSDSSKVSSGYAQLARVRLAQGDREEALRLARRSLALVRTEDQLPHRIADRLGLEASILYDLNRFDEQMVALEEGETLLRQTYGPSHTLTAELRLLRGRSLAERGEYERGIDMMKETLPVLESNLGTNRRVVHALTRLGDAYLRVDKLEESKELFERGLAMQSNLAGPDDIMTAELQSNLCGVLFYMNEIEPALDQCSQALNTIASVPESDPGIVAKMQINYGAALFRAGQIDEALEEYQKAQDIMERTYGSDHIATAILVSNIAEVEMVRGHLDRAESLYEDSLATREQLYGRAHPMLIHPLIGLAKTLLRAQNWSGAEARAKRALDVQQVYDMKTDLVETRFVLVQALWELGDMKQVLRYGATLSDDLAKAPSDSILAVEMRAWLDDHPMP